MRPALLLVLLAGLSLGCGQRGDLYLRDNPPAGVKPAKSAGHKPIAYPQPVGDPADAENKP